MIENFDYSNKQRDTRSLYTILMKIQEKVNEIINKINSVEDVQDIISYRKLINQSVSDLSGENDNIITFETPNVESTNEDILSFDGTILVIKKRHPLKFNKLKVDLFIENELNEEAQVTVKFLVSTDGVNFNLLSNEKTFPVRARQGSKNEFTFVQVSDWISKQPSTVPVYFKVQVFSNKTVPAISINSANIDVEVLHKSQ